MPLSITDLLMAILAVSVCGSAVIFGSRNERLGGAFYLGAYLLNVALGMALGPAPATLVFLFCDGLCLIGFLYLCWKAPHPWPLWAFGWQLLAFMADVLALNLRGLVLRSTLVALHDITGCLVLLCLLVGTITVLKNRQARTQSAKIG